MLAKCLGSIQSMILPDECSLKLVLVENDQCQQFEMSSKEQMESTPEIEFHYVLEQNLGIPIARNKSIECALLTKPDWIAFIDDDETMTVDWLVNLVDVIKSNQADVHVGPVKYLPPAETPIWYKNPVTYKHEDGTLLATAATNNTIANAAFFDGRKSRLRFDESLRFTGGEDVELFDRLVRAGGKIRYTRKVLVTESVDAARMSVKWMLNREFSWGNNSVRLEIKNAGVSKVILRDSYKILHRILEGIFYFTLGVILIPFSKRGKKHLVGGMKKLAWSLGCCSSFFSYQAEPYRNIEGN